MPTPAGSMSGTPSGADFLVIVATARGVCFEKKTRYAGDRSAEEVRAHGEQEAQRLIREGLAAAGFGAEDLPKRPGSNPIKSVLAEIVWSRTSVNMEWIAQALNMRSAGNVRQQIRRRKAEQITERARKAEKYWTKSFRKWRKQSQLLA
jgi:hypothetical protein